MRIAFFVQYNHPAGTYFRWHNMAKALQALGHQVDVYAGDHNWRQKVRIEDRDGIPYSIVPSLPTVRLFYAPNDIFTALRWLFHLPKKEYDVYHLYQPFLHASLTWNLLRYKKREAVFVYDWDDLWTGGLFQQPKGCRNRYLMWVTNRLEKKLPRCAKGVTVCSHFLKEKLSQQQNVALIFNGYWPKAVPNKRDLRLKWGFKETAFYMAYIGKTADELDWVIAAHAYIQNKISIQVDLVIAGPPKDYVHQLLGDSVLIKNIQYLGILNADDAGSLAAAVDLGLIPLANNAFNQSRFPVKFLDFLSVQTPVYVSKVGEIGHIAEGLTGAFAGPAEKTNWVQGLLHVVNTITTNYPERPNKDELEPYTWLHLAQQQINFYKNLQGIS